MISAARSGQASELVDDSRLSSLEMDRWAIDGLTGSQLVSGRERAYAWPSSAGPEPCHFLHMWTTFPARDIRVTPGA